MDERIHIAIFALLWCSQHDLSRYLVWRDRAPSLDQVALLLSVEQLRSACFQEMSDVREHRLMRKKINETSPEIAELYRLFVLPLVESGALK